MPLPLYRHLLHLAVAAVLSAFLTSCSSSSVPTYSAAIQEGQTAAQEMLSQNNASAIAIALVNRDRVIWSETFGFADQDKGVAPTATTMFSMASASKMFATVAVMKLVEKGLVALDTPFVNYVKTFSMADPRYRDITVRMLLNHSSGFPGTDYRNVQTTSPRTDYLDQVLESLAHAQLKAVPGYTNVYCNDGFTLIEALIPAVTGKSYAQFVQDEIFTPLGMSQSRFALEPFADGTFARVYTNGIPQPQDFLNALASGGAYSTASDMAQFARIFLGRGTVGTQRVLTPESLTAMAEDQTINRLHPARSGTMTFGLGWDTVAQPGLGGFGGGTRAGIRRWATTVLHSLLLPMRVSPWSSWGPPDSVPTWQPQSPSGLCFGLWLKMAGSPAFRSRSPKSAQPPLRFLMACLPALPACMPLTRTSFGSILNPTGHSS